MVELRDWQKEALEAVECFSDASKSPVVVAPTGSGKTLFGIEYLKGVHGRSIVVVPTKALESQWNDELPDTLKKNVVVRYVNNAIAEDRFDYDFALFDEVPNYVTDKRLPFLEKMVGSCRNSMAMTAYFYRKEQNLNNKLNDLFKVAYEYSVERAISDKVITDYVVKDVRVKPDTATLEILDDCRENLKESFEALEGLFSVAKPDDIASFIRSKPDTDVKSINQKLNSDFPSQRVGIMKEILTFMANRLANGSPEKHNILETLKRIGEAASRNGQELALLVKTIKNAEEKFDVVVNLIEDLKGEKLILFTDWTDVALRVMGMLQERGYDSVFHYDAGESDEIKDSVIDDFSRAENGVLINSRALGEGLDVPSISSCIFMNGSSTHNEFKQRVGRALRIYPGKEKAVAYQVFLEGTYDEKWAHDRIKDKSKYEARGFSDTYVPVMPKSEHTVFVTDKDVESAELPAVKTVSENVAGKSEVERNPKWFPKKDYNRKAICECSCHGSGDWYSCCKLNCVDSLPESPLFETVFSRDDVFVEVPVEWNGKSWTEFHVVKTFNGREFKLFVTKGCYNAIQKFFKSNPSENRCSVRKSGEGLYTKWLAIKVVTG